MLKGRWILVTGVITESSIAYAVARVAAEEGAHVLLTGYGRLSLVERIARRLDPAIPVVELDVTDADQLASLAERLGRYTDVLHGVVHSIGYAPPSTMGDDLLAAAWPDVSVALHVSTYSLASLARAALPLLPEGGSIVGLDFDASRAWPGYGWMGVAKAGLESCTRYLARELGPRGIRVNLVASGPLRTLAARAIPAGTDAASAAAERVRFEAGWDRLAPLGWRPHDAGPVARTCAVLLSDWLPATTGCVLPADGGAHAMGCVPDEGTAAGEVGP